MTQKDSTIRLRLYIVAAVLSAASAGVQAVDFADPRETIGFVLGVCIAGVTAWRAYIDSSQAQVPIPPKPVQQTRS
jgi:uncharacterized membrane protein